MKTFSYNPAKAIILTNNFIQKTSRTNHVNKVKKIIAEEYLAFGIMAGPELLVQTAKNINEITQLIPKDKSFFSCEGTEYTDYGKCNLSDYIESRKYILYLTDQAFKYVTSVMKEIHCDINNPLM
jgi:hypothetical protein